MSTEYPKPDSQLVVGRESGAAPAQPADEITLPTPRPEDRLPGLTWEGEVPPTKWMQFYTKVLSRFAVGGGLKLSVKVKIRPSEGVSKQRKTETETALNELGLEDKTSSLE